MFYTPGKPASSKVGYVYLGSILRKNISSWEEIWNSLEIFEVEKRLPNEEDSENILHCEVLKTEYEADPAPKNKRPKKRKKEHVPDPKPNGKEEEDDEDLPVQTRCAQILPPANAILVSPKKSSDWPIKIEILETVQVKDVHRLDKMVYATSGKYRAKEEKIHEVLHLIIEVEPFQELRDLHFHFGLALASWQMKVASGRVQITK